MDNLPEMRVSDQDRQAAADRLRAAQNEGRLDLLEYDNRLARAYAAVTYRDLDELFTDLPAQPSAGGTQLTGWAADSARRAARANSPVELFRRMPTPLKILWTIWLAVLSVNLTVWLLVSLGNGEPVYFWPMWLLVPGAALPGVTAGVLAMRGGRLQHRELPAGAQRALDPPLSS